MSDMATLPVELRRRRGARLLRRTFPHGPVDVLRQVALFAAAYYTYRLVRGFGDNPSGASVAFENSRRLIDLEHTLHVFVEPSVQGWAQRSAVVTDIASSLYINAQTSVTLAALVYIYVAHNARFYFVRNMFMVAMGIAMTSYVVYPTAPPRFFPEWGFFDTVSDFTGIGHANHRANALYNPYAAVPSMHVCFALMIAIPLARVARRRAASVLLALYPLLVTFVIVATANHFVVDAFLGACTAAIAAGAAVCLARARPEVWRFTPRALSG